MPINKIHESAVTGRGGLGCTLPVDVIEDDGSIARIQVQGTGIYLTQGETHTVASGEVRH